MKIASVEQKLLRSNLNSTWRPAAILLFHPFALFPRWNAYYQCIFQVGKPIGKCYANFDSSTHKRAVTWDPAMLWCEIWLRKMTKSFFRRGGGTFWLFLANLRVKNLNVDVLTPKRHILHRKHVFWPINHRNRIFALGCSQHDTASKKTHKNRPKVVFLAYSPGGDP